MLPLQTACRILLLLPLTSTALAAELSGEWEVQAMGADKKVIIQQDGKKLVAHRASYVDFIFRCFAHGACGEVDDGSADVLSSDLDFSCVNATANLDACLGEECLKFSGCINGGGWCLERGEYSVARQLDELPVVRRDGVACDSVVTIEFGCPGVISCCQ